MVTQEDPDITGLNSNVIYSKLDRASNDYINHKNPFWNTVIKFHPFNKLKIFDVIAKGSLYIASLNNENIFYDQRWNYLYFWAGSKVLQSSESSSFSDIMELINTVKGYIDNQNKYNDDMLKISTDKFNDLKKIYDYLESYKSILAKINYKDAPCTSAYRDYVTKAYDFYIEQKTQCKENTTDIYCKLVNHFVGNYVKNNITKLTCTGTKPVEVHHAVRSPQGLHGSDDLSLELSSRREESNAMLTPYGGISPSTGSTNVTSFVFPLLGTLSMLFVFFKFSPLGSWIYDSILKKKIIRNYEQEEEQEILENPCAYLHTDFQENEHHIAYHSGKINENI
ncbi:PIR Superfamily Protein [Plasmodium ovale wallikeri]|uniref:PIR Superfamily Protein n=1 Tax=Plasmodium ovale wallikeri TaxID=864142 RepID=A0A1A9AF46_PLAOA|nr:PIR Superfamily Protein [Plasmodium ovale wallikeri]